MSTIEVTNPLAVDVATLALHTCATCGRHVWLRDGVELDRADVLAVVRGRLDGGPARVPAPRARRAAPAVEADPSDVPAVGPDPAVLERLAQFRVLGS